MRKSIIVLAALAAVAVPAIAGATFSEIPSYYSQLDYNLTGPSAWPTAVGGYANPAVYATMPGGELQYFWTDFSGDTPDGLRRWGLFTSGQHIGFGAIHQRVPAGTGTWSVTDYRFALSFGDRQHSLGVGLGWSRGDTDQLGRTTVMQVGAVRRVSRFASLGLVGTFSTEKDDQAGLADVAVRPLGDQRLTLFGDLELAKGFALEDAPWSAGAMLEFVPGVKVIGRYFEDESFALSLAWTFGGAMNGGFARAEASPRFDDGGDVMSTVYGGRLGYPERSAVSELFDRDAYYLKMPLKGPVVHTRYKYFDSGRTLYSLLTQLETVRTDPRFSGVAINLSGARMSRGNAWELREKLKEVQAAGKKVVVMIDEAGMTLYHLASVADVVVMDPEGFVVLQGYAMGRTFIAEMLEKIGVGFDEWRFLEYKSAAEPLSRTSMSDADREQRKALVDGYYDTMRADVAASRGVSPTEFDRWIDDVTLFSARAAMEEGLVDSLGRWEDVKDAVKGIEGEGKRYASAKDVEESRPADTSWDYAPEIAVVYALGACAMDEGINARRLDRIFKRLEKDETTKAVVLRVNSPGGSAMASDVVAESMKKCAKKKPVIVSQGDVAASGGYWISMYADEIIAQPTTITGSIGVIGGWVWDDGMMEKLGMRGDFVQRGESADLMFEVRFPFIGLGLPHRPMTLSERDRVLDLMRAGYDGFVGKVAEGRGMSTDAVEKVAQGRVWTGAEGVERGLVDRTGGLQTAIDVARQKAGIDDEKIRVVQYGTKGLFDIGDLLPGPFRFGGGESAASFIDPLAFLFDYDAEYVKRVVDNNGRALYILPPEYMPRESEGGLAR